MSIDVLSFRNTKSKSMSKGEVNDDLGVFK